MDSQTFGTIVNISVITGVVVVMVGLYINHKTGIEPAPDDEDPLDLGVPMVFLGCFVSTIVFAILLIAFSW